MTKWIKDWFGSEYYCMLYKHRDSDEAEKFLNNLIALLRLSPDSKILDCGCGKGRHSIHLSKKGFRVTGIDISEKNISDARLTASVQKKKDKNKNLSFRVHDMRNLFKADYYDAALNLFTSFGYFDEDSENEKEIKSIAAALKKNGWLVLDFMNTEKEIKGLIPSEKLFMGGIGFEVKRFVKNNCIIKEISVSDKGKKYLFSEKVKTYKRTELENFFNQNNLEVVHLLGDYQLNPFNETTSKRLIIIGKK